MALHAIDVVAGISVALFFGSGRVRRCRNFLPYLVNFYRTINESSDRQKVEVIYVSVDESQEEFVDFTQMHPWLFVFPRQELVRPLTQHFGVVANEQAVAQFGHKRQILPYLVVIGADGRTLREVDMDLQPFSEHTLTDWDYTGLPFF